MSGMTLQTLDPFGGTVSHQLSPQRDWHSCSTLDCRRARYLNGLCKLCSDLAWHRRQRPEAG